MTVVNGRFTEGVVSPVKAEPLCLRLLAWQMEETKYAGFVVFRFDHDSY